MMGGLRSTLVICCGLQQCCVNGVKSHKKVQAHLTVQCDGQGFEQAAHDDAWWKVQVIANVDDVFAIEVPGARRWQQEYCGLSRTAGTRRPLLA